MSARYAVLGMLRDGPAYNYELSTRIHELFGPGFDINTGQMSRLTRELVDKELITPVPGSVRASRRGGAANRRVYAITTKGEADYEEFFENSPDKPQLFRRSLLVKIALAGPERLEEVLSQLEQYEQDCTNRINELSRTLDAILPDDHVHPRVDRVVLRLGVEADVSQLRAELGWARHAREMVSWLLRSDASWPTSPRQARRTDRAQARRDEAREQMLQRLRER